MSQCKDNIRENAYILLGVSKSDPIDVIDHKYKRLVRKYHPDKAKTREEQKMYLKMFTLVNSAYEYIASTFADSSVPVFNEQKSDDHHFFNGNILDYNTNCNNTLNDQYTTMTRNTNIHANTEADYSNFSYEAFNPFETRSISNEDFNKAFEYNQNAYKNGNENTNPTTSGELLPYSQGGNAIALCKGTSNNFTDYTKAFSCAHNPEIVIDTTQLPSRDQVNVMPTEEMRRKIESYNSVFSHVSRDDEYNRYNYQY